MEKLVVGQVQQFKTIEMCYDQGYPTNMCPTLQDDLDFEVYTVGEFPISLQRVYDPYSNMYTQVWRVNPNYSYTTRPPIPLQQLSSTPVIFLEEIIKSPTTNIQ